MVTACGYALRFISCFATSILVLLLRKGRGERGEGEGNDFSVRLQKFECSTLLLLSHIHKLWIRESINVRISMFRARERGYCRLK